jgi:CDP-4-dehydro-6-deoxyglucose reductase
MTQRVGVAKAARLLGVSRMTLQQLIRNGQLSTFEGEVDLDELCKRFPGLAFNQSPMLERANIIKDSAFGERVKQQIVPSTDTLQEQIKRLKVELNVERGKARKYQALIEDLLSKMTKIRQYDELDDKARLEELNLWLLEQFRKL